MSNPTVDNSHGAFAFKRETRVSGKWLDIGKARVEFDIAKFPEHLRPLIPLIPQLLRLMRCHVFLDRTPIGGFSGHVFLNPVGEEPPVPRSQSQQVEKESDPLEGEF